MEGIRNFEFVGCVVADCLVADGKEIQIGRKNALKML